MTEEKKMYYVLRNADKLKVVLEDRNRVLIAEDSDFFQIMSSLNALAIIATRGDAFLEKNESKLDPIK